jgi:GNAT superfamily N-acetyltransferase
VSVISIRPAVAADANAVWDLLGQLAHSVTPRRDAFDASFGHILAHDDEHLMVAHVGDTVIGYVVATVHNTLYANAPVCWVAELVVDFTWRRRGVGALLMDAVEDWAVARGCALVTLATGRAVAFYTAIGYQETATYLKKSLLD